MERAKRFIVEVHSSFTVEADAPDSALRAVLPIVAGAENVNFGVREAVATPPRLETQTEPYVHLTKSTYKVNEVAEILGLSRNLVYEKVPCIRVGSRRLYPRGTIVEILQHGLKSEEPAIRPVQHCWRESPQKPVKIVTSEPLQSGPTSKKKADDSKTLTMKQTAALLGVSYSKAKELFDSRRIYSVESYGKRIILRSAVEHFLKGGTAREYVEGLIKYAREHNISL